MSVDLNNFLAPVVDMLPDPNNVPVVRNLFNTASAFVAGHELGHLMGLNGLLDPGEDINGNGILDSASYDGPLMRTADFPDGEIIRNNSRDPIIINLELPDSPGSRTE